MEVTDHMRAWYHPRSDRRSCCHGVLQVPGDARGLPRRDLLETSTIHITNAVAMEVGDLFSVGDCSLSMRDAMGALAAGGCRRHEPRLLWSHVSVSILGRRSLRTASGYILSLLGAAPDRCSINSMRLAAFGPNALHRSVSSRQCTFAGWSNSAEILSSVGSSLASGIHQIEIVVHSGRV